MIEKTLKKLAMAAADAVVIILSIYLSLYIVRGAHVGWPTYMQSEFFIWLTFCTILMWGNHAVLGMYRIRWEYASIREMLRVVLVVAAVTFEIYAASRFFNTETFLRTHLIFTVIMGMGMIAIRISYRVMRYLQSEYIRNRGGEGGRIVIVGAGEAGNLLLMEINRNPERGQVVGFVDDSKDKLNNSIKGIPILGTTKEIITVCENVDANEIMIALPSAESPDIKRVLTECKKTPCRILLMPSVKDLMGESASVTQLRSVEPEDLLGRDPVDLNVDDISDYIRDKVVLITGAGGSIGSELCRQIAGYRPLRMILLDIYENNVYELRHELRRRFVDQEMDVVIASVRDKKRLDVVFNRYKPNIVFHAAAHKHVPLMEFSPGEAVKNNVFGSLNVARMADKYKADRFVLISTDKAVNPTNVMGATKRIAEQVISAINKISSTSYVAVRFGNVLGSNGSVIPLFKRQIAAGGPVTVTHPDMMRYFMTITEASQLVLQAGALVESGELFILDMGEMVNIDTMARDLIRLSGFKPNEDIKIVYTGLRPGEKMYEELLSNKEDLEKTRYKKIFIGEADVYEYQALMQKLEHLWSLLDQDDEKIVDKIKELVPEFGLELKKKAAAEAAQQAVKNKLRVV